jgi:hypothetical protein
MGCCSRPIGQRGGYRNTENSIAIAYLRMSKLVHLPTSPFEDAKPRSRGFVRRCARSQVPYRAVIKPFFDQFFMVVSSTPST